MTDPRQAYLLKLKKKGLLTLLEENVTVHTDEVWIVTTGEEMVIFEEET